MAKANRNFELSIEDLELIEDSLRATKRDITLNEDTPHEEPVARRIHDLLGRLHNQKTFYRPAKGAYIGG